MTIDRLNSKVEKTFRDALGHAARGELAEMNGLLNCLSDEYLAACLGLCLFVSGYVAIDVCGRQWPNESNLRKIANGVIEGTNAEEYGLTEQEAYDFIARAALRREPLEAVFPDVSKVAELPFVVTAHFLTGYHPPGEKWWEFLDVIEDALEKAWAIDLNVLPALMLRSRMPALPTATEAQRQP